MGGIDRFQAGGTNWILIPFKQLSGIHEKHFCERLDVKHVKSDLVISLTKDNTFFNFMDDDETEYKIQLKSDTTKICVIGRMLLIKLDDVVIDEFPNQ